MVRQTLLLLADVELLDIIDQFLLQAVTVVLHPRNLLQTVNDAGLDLFHTALLVRLDGCQQTGDVVNLLRKLLLKGGTLLLAEVHEAVEGLLHGSLHCQPFLVVQLFHVRLCQHVRHPQQRIEVVFRHRDTRLFRDGLDLLVIILHEGRIDRRWIHSHILFYPHTHVHLTTDESLGNHLAHLHLLLTVERCNTGVQVKLL